MKKTITKPDGSKEVLEGTPEEIAELERRIRQEPIREEPKKPGLLTEDDVTRRFQELIEEAMKEKNFPIQPSTIDQQWRWQHSPFCEITTAQRGWLSVIPPRCTCGLFIYPGERYSPILDIQTQPYRLTMTYHYCGYCGKPKSGLNNSDLCSCSGESHVISWNEDSLKGNWNMPPINNQCGWKL